MKGKKPENQILLNKKTYLAVKSEDEEKKGETDGCSIGRTIDERPSTDLKSLKKDGETPTQRFEHRRIGFLVFF